MRPVPSFALLGALALHALLLLGPWLKPDSAAPAPILKVKARLLTTPASSPPAVPPPSAPEGRKPEPAASITTFEPQSASVAPIPTDPAQESATPGPAALSWSEPASAVPAALEPDFYLRLVREAVAGQRQYPYSARVRGQQGTAVVRFALDSSGALLAPPRIARSSGAPRLDEAARAAVSAAAPFAPPPPGFEASFDLPVEFVLNSSP